ncbi:hypothetical protein DESUT3_18030 [Desulfuromonas versatilis]|uniref:DUF3793 family protein n=1 Tax=Desulfuromonas versatilis TaxID=2802975 RepID=A0ABM8HR29_9BACT|nr:DUF3793 family protein [Desulfuromonas versatilis]BCR04734.1 hypothetical protein DESUT3_18030 [Desulfuromonas versatilis]
MPPRIAERQPALSDVPLWKEISPRFATDRDCLAAFLALETAEILEGVKPGNLVNLVNRTQVCGRNLYHLWKAFGPALATDCGLESRVLCDRGSSLLIYFYDRQAMENLIHVPGAKALLKRSGYPEELSLDAALSLLQNRISGDFPHEIGVFLGYPLKDVAAFMGLVSIPFACQGPWKIYGDPTRSLHLAEVHRASRRRMAWRVARCSDPRECLNRSACSGKCATRPAA